MSSFKLGYLAYPVMIGLCGAWAFSGFMFSGGVQIGDVSDPVQAVKVQPTKPDFDIIDQKNIFKADISSVKNTLDSVNFMPSGGSDQSGAAAAAQPAILLGIIKGSYISYAIVSYKNDNLILQQGIPKKGVVLKKVRHDSVDIQTDKGQLMTIRLKQLGGQEQTAQTPPGQQPPQAQPGAGGQQKLSITRKEVTEQLSDVNSVMKAVAINPYEDKGKFVGYKLTNIRPDSALLKLGLVSGDVIIRLNGQQLKNPSVFFDALANSENLSALVLDIQRNNVKKTLNVEIKG